MTPDPASGQQYRPVLRNFGAPSEGEFLTNQRRISEICRSLPV